jgi:hypothetical protein
MARDSHPRWCGTKDSLQRISKAKMVMPSQSCHKSCRLRSLLELRSHSRTKRLSLFVRVCGVWMSRCRIKRREKGRSSRYFPIYCYCLFFSFHLFCISGMESAKSYWIGGSHMHTHTHTHMRRGRFGFKPFNLLLPSLCVSRLVGFFGIFCGTRKCDRLGLVGNYVLLGRVSLFLAGIGFLVCVHVGVVSVCTYRVLGWCWWKGDKMESLSTYFLG